MPADLTKIHLYLTENALFFLNKVVVHGYKLTCSQFRESVDNKRTTFPETEMLKADTQPEVSNTL